MNKRKTRSKASAAASRTGPQGRAAALSPGAPPSNTAPANCIHPGIGRILRTGVDSLYLSYPGQVSIEADTRLATLKELAQSAHPGDPALAVYPVQGHHFEVRPRGRGRFPYVLVDNAYQLSIKNHSSASLPLCYAQIASDWLLAQGVENATDGLADIVEEFGLREPGVLPQVGRADLYVDFISELPLEGLDIYQFVSRAKRTDTYTVNRQCSGYTIGLGGDISARLYDKTLEIESSNKPYWRDVWFEQGWQPGQKVWRLEFEFKRRVLVEHGIETVPDLLDKMGPLWRYATLSWLKLTIPSTTDTTQSRWPLHPVWAVLADVDWPGSSACISLPIRSDRSPTDRHLYENGLSGLTSYMAKEKITDADEAFERYHQDARIYHNRRGHITGIDYDGYLRERAALKARRYNLDYPGVEEKRQERVRSAVARKHKDMKDGS